MAASAAVSPEQCSHADSQRIPDLFTVYFWPEELYGLLNSIAKLQRRNRRVRLVLQIWTSRDVHAWQAAPPTPQAIEDEVIQERAPDSFLRTDIDDPKR